MNLIPQITSLYTTRTPPPPRPSRQIQISNHKPSISITQYSRRAFDMYKIVVHENPSFYFQSYILLHKTRKSNSRALNKRKCENYIYILYIVYVYTYTHLILLMNMYVGLYNIRIHSCAMCSINIFNI